jgi:hypothetical protein
MDVESTHTNVQAADSDEQVRPVAQAEAMDMYIVWMNTRNTWIRLLLYLISVVCCLPLFAMFFAFSYLVGVCYTFFLLFLKDR